MKDHYQILEVEPNASQDSIKEQYRFLVQAWHPDKFSNPTQKLKAEEKLKEINAAYEILGNSAKRAEYDSRARYNTFTSNKQEHRERTAPRQSEDDRRKNDDSARRAEEEQRQKERGNRERAEDARRQRINQLNQEISLINQEISKLDKELPKMPTPIFAFLFLVSGFYGFYLSPIVLFNSPEIGIFFPFISIIAINISLRQFSSRNKFYRENYKPVFDEIDKRKHRIQQLIRERNYLI